MVQLVLKQQNYGKSPNPKCLNLLSADTMAGSRIPPILRSVREDLQEDVCLLTNLLAETHLAVSKSCEVYSENPHDIHTNSHEAYHQYRDRFGG